MICLKPGSSPSWPSPCGLHNTFTHIMGLISSCTCHAFYHTHFTMDIQYVSSQLQFDTFLRENKYLVANFTASWCGPCNAIKPVVDQIYSNPKFSKIEIVRVDLDQCGAVAAKYGVSSVPTFVFFVLGSETRRIAGAAELQTAFDLFAETANSDAAYAGRRAAAPKLDEEVLKLVPKGFEVLNGGVHFGEMVTLNLTSLHRGNDVKDVLRPELKASVVVSDADSQALLFVPLNYISKVYSILVKFASLSDAEGDLELDSDELADETQTPSLIKVWPNRPGIPSFDDAAGDSNAPHVEKIAGSDGWYEVRLKYVRFQKVQNLTIFIDGDDEDMHTVVEKIVLVGVSGESTETISVNAED